MTGSEIRKRYLEFFKRHGHAVVPSARLMPENDPTTLFTGSGMQPLLPYLLGQPHLLGTRITDSQKSFRAQDIEEVGDNRHTTFFEMLGNWSLGDYFKKEQIPWIFEFVTKEVGLDPERLHITVFRGREDLGIPRDDEAVKLWQEVFKGAGIDAPAVDFAERDGMQDGRIFYYDEKKNWWSRAGVPENMPIGEPGGPDSEMFWDFGSELKLHENSQWKDEVCHVNCDCGRFMEIGNSVFMQFVKTEKGFEPLKNQNIDFGGGLERIAGALNDNPDMFLIDLFTPMREILEKLSGKKYGENPNETRAFRVVMDHLRAATFLIGDGAMPSNKDQGYFVRRLLRRAILFAHKLGITENFTESVAAAVVEKYKDAYSELEERKEKIFSEMTVEEERFRTTLVEGLKAFEKVAEGKKPGDELPSKQVFDLHQSYGFPFEMTVELSDSMGTTVSRSAFQKEMEKHQEISRQGLTQKFKGGLADSSEETTRLHTAHHLLLKALQIVLGAHVKQRGSNITAERLRIDFSHGEKMTAEQVAEVQRIVNEKISEDLPVIHSVLPKGEAEKLHAEHEFGAKYPDMVSIYSVGPKGATEANPQFDNVFSIEFCGGPHVTHTGAIGKFKILKEEAVSAGIRRIKAVVE